MASKVIFRQQAEDDFAGVYLHVAAASGRETALAYVERIRRACLDLQTCSGRGRRRDDVLAGLRTLGFERRVLIAYHMAEPDVEIVRILYGGRDFERLLGGY